MPTVKYFNKCPPFPTTVATLDIPTISLIKLEENEQDEFDRLFHACRTYGFFRLHLQESWSGRALLTHAEAMLDVGTETLSLGKEVLDEYAYNPPKDLLGYKTAGKVKTDDGKLDAMEMYTLGQDETLSKSPVRKIPPPLEAQRPQCRDFFVSAGSVIGTLLSALDKILELPRGSLSGFCSPEKPSDTSLRMLLSHSTSEAKRITLGGHTDIGVITMLFNIVGGLQILPAGASNKFDNWAYIKPTQGSAIINLGDTMVEWTGGLLRSGLHRVVNPPGEQAKVPRKSLAYLVRPAREMTMRRLRSSRIPKLEDGEEENGMGVTEWAAARAMQILKGELRPRTTGGDSRVHVASKPLQ